MNYLHSLAPVAETLAENPELALAGGRIRRNHHKHHEYHQRAGGALLPAGYGIHHKKAHKKSTKKHHKRK